MLFSKQPSLEIGDAIPDVSARNQEGDVVRLSTLAEEAFCLVFFFPYANTPGCTAQACSLRDAFEDLVSLNVSVFGVSQNTVESLKDFASGKQLPYPLISDKECAVISAFGVPSFMGLTKRQAFLFQRGKLVWRDTSASTKKQAEDVVRAIYQLRGNVS